MNAADFDLSIKGGRTEPGIWVTSAVSGAELSAASMIELAAAHVKETLRDRQP